MKRSWRYVLVLTILLANILGACDGPVEEPSETATARIIGTDGLGVAVDPVTFQLTHIPGEASSPRVASINDGPQHLTQVELSVQRTGIPLGGSYHLLNMSQGIIYPESNDPLTGVAGPGPNGFNEQSIGDLVELRVRNDQLDSPLSSSFSNFYPPAPVPDSELTPVRTTGYSYLVRIKEDDISIPFEASNELTDTSRIIDGIFTGLASGIRGSISSDPRIALGGPDADGDFRMYFVPHVTHAGLTESGRNVKGVGFILAFSVTVLDPALNSIQIGLAHVFLPISLLFEPETVQGGMGYRIFMDPFDLIGSVTQPENLDRINVYATSIMAGFTNGLIADQVRTGMISSLNNLPPATLNSISTQMAMLALGINSYRVNNQNIPDDFDVILLPQGPVLTTTVLNKVAPFQEGIPLRLVILE